MCFYKTFYVAYELPVQKSYYVTQLACDFEMSCRFEAVPVKFPSTLHFVDLKPIS